MFLFFRQNTFTSNLQILHLFYEYGKEHYKNNTTKVTLHRYFIILPINHIIIWIIQHRKSRIVFQLWFWKIQIRVNLAYYRNVAVLLTQHCSNRLYNFQGSHDYKLNKTISKQEFSPLNFSLFSHNIMVFLRVKEMI